MVSLSLGFVCFGGKRKTDGVVCVGNVDLVVLEMVVALQWFLFLNCHHIKFRSSLMIVDAVDGELCCCCVRGKP